MNKHLLRFTVAIGTVIAIVGSILGITVAVIFVVSVSPWPIQVATGTAIGLIPALLFLWIVTE